MEIDRILDDARVLDCSDVHLTVGMPPIVRQAGALRKLNEYPELMEYAILQMSDHMAHDIARELIKNQKDADFTYISLKGFRHRVNVYRQSGHTAVAIRLLRNEIPTISELKLPSILADFASRPRGLVLVTGPTGSGKSTTLAAMINHINLTKSAHIITIEDPIEYVHDHKRCMINQREIGIDVSDFSSALRSALREDPDVILVGEMRDYETINAAITAAETGHLVLSTLHTSSAATTIDRIIDVFPGAQQKQIRTQLASVLVGICTQLLVPKADNAGRIACMEVLNATDAIKAMIRDDKVHMIPTAIQTGKNLGMQSRDQELARLVKGGFITLENALDRCSSSKDLNQFLLNA